MRALALRGALATTALVGLALLLAACNFSDRRGVGAGPGGAGATASATPALAADLLRVVTTIETGDRGAIAKLLQTSKQNCTQQQGGGGPPKCATGEAEGTAVDVFPYTACEREWVRTTQIDNLMRTLFVYSFDRYAAYTAGKGAVLVFSAPTKPAVGAGLAATVEGGRVTALRRTCGPNEPPSNLIAPGQTSFLLAPPKP